MRRGFWYGMILGGLAAVGLAAVLAPGRMVRQASRLARVRRRLRQGARRVFGRPALRAGASVVRRLGR